MAEPLVSVIVPVFRGEPFIERTLDSVTAQTYPQVETIVVDDGSPDRGGEIAATRPGVRVLRQQNLGVAAARNRGVAAAGGELLAFLDQDDEWRPQKLARQVAFLRRRPEVGMVKTHIEMVLGEGVARPDWIEPGWLTRPQPGHVPSTWLVRRTAFEQVGPFDVSFVTGSDADWLARAKDAGVRSEMLKEWLVTWRVHGANSSYDQQTMRKDFLRLMRSTVRRQREVADGD